MALTALILAAGKGTRMKSDLPKVLHRLCGEPMVRHVIQTVRELALDRCVVVVGHGAEMVKSELAGENVEFVVQDRQLGTGHAVMMAEHLLPSSGDVLLLCGDTPLIRAETLKKLVDYHRSQKAQATILTALFANPFGYGRIVRDGSHRVVKIVEEKDASPEEKKINEINSGIYCFAVEALRRALRTITPQNAQGEYYLTDVIPAILAEGGKVEGFALEDCEEILGINDRRQLAQADKIMRLRVAEKLMLEGITIVDPALTFIDKGVKIGKDTVIYPNVYIEGKTEIGTGCVIRGNTRITDCILGDNCTVENSVLVQSTFGQGVTIGPFAYVRPGTVVEAEVKIGDFVEIKNSVIGTGTKVPHLSYIGDSHIGKKVNIGAGTITCNYDGVAKHRTVVEDGAFIGSNSSLVAPVTIGKGAIIGAGSAISKDVPPNALGITRATQKNIENFSEKRQNKRR